LYLQHTKQKETNIMNTRLLGTLCIIGSLIGMADATRNLLMGQQMVDGLRQLDAISSIAMVLAAIGGLCGVLGLVALRATGSNPVFRLLTYLPGISYVAMMFAGLGLFTGLLKTDADNPVVLVAYILGDILNPLAWIVVSILTIAAKSWQGWRRFAPLAIVLAFPLGIVASGVIGLVGAFGIVNYAAVVLLGYALQSSEARSTARHTLGTGSLGDPQAQL
jgi:hypothetical protein